jgi:hypothetical protein
MKKLIMVSLILLLTTSCQKDIYTCYNIDNYEKLDSIHYYNNETSDSLLVYTYKITYNNTDSIINSIVQINDKTLFCVKN